MNKRIFIERQTKFTIEANQLQSDIKNILGIEISSLRYFIVYDIFDISETLYKQSKQTIFAEPNKDHLYETVPKQQHIIAYESLPGQFDQRADSAMQSLRLLDPSSTVVVRSGVVVSFHESITENQVQQIKNYLINAVESREKDLSLLELPRVITPEPVQTINGFIEFDKRSLKLFYETFGFAMSLEDLAFVQSYFINETRNPTETELRVLDTYWSDHCRHTTFETEIREVSFDGQNELSKVIQDTFHEYLSVRQSLHRQDKPLTLMDLATINAKWEFQKGNLGDLEVSEEVNAASIYIDVDVDGKTEKWLLMFKNETHNHPTEIEPFGGASTCIGGAIRDPLSGRSYVYSAMRVTGAANINESFNDTMEGKLPQHVISKEAAHGYSSYGNQIGLATTFVEELHHPGYKAKRMEIGAVIGAVPAEYVRRESPAPGDVILLLGGRTGRDGIGGATGSSKEHTIDSLDQSSAEVQKGNAPEERKIQRLFRNNEVTKKIKKSNDFGAGGVCVAIGELADGLVIDLNKVPTKYKGINGTELAISESQERMAVVVDPKDVSSFEELCHMENIEVSRVAEVTKEKRLIMHWNNETICDLKRDFIDTSGVRQQTSILVPEHNTDTLLHHSFNGCSIKEQLESMLQDDNIASKQGMEEMFDSSIGRTTVLSPYGGKYKQTKTQVSCQQIPTRKKGTNTVSLMAYGFNPYLSEQSPYHGSMYAIIDSIAKIVSTGGDYKKIRFTFQEYYQKLLDNPVLWSKPFRALLGAFKTLSAFELPAIGGKDSMSGTYHDLHVPPTLVSFAVTTADKNHVISPEWKQSDSYLYLYTYEKDNAHIPDFKQLQENYTTIYNQINNKTIVSAYAVGYGGLAEALIKPTFGNRIGIKVDTDLDLFDYRYGAIVVESTKPIKDTHAVLIGKTTSDSSVRINGTAISIEQALAWNQTTYQEIYPLLHQEDTIQTYPDTTMEPVEYRYVEPVDEVNVLIPVFPGTNCEYDSEDVFSQRGASTTMVVFNNQTESDIHQSIQTLCKKIEQSHIIFLSGGFSSGDEPDGSGKFIATVLRHPDVAVAIRKHLDKKRLIIGICNGFQALVKSGLLPYGTIQPLTTSSPTLFKNKINRHIAHFTTTKVSSIHSPWLQEFDLKERHTIPLSHGEGRFILSEEEYQTLYQNNQIAFQYVNEDNESTNDPRYNPNGSAYAIEGIVSKDGLILGKMGHSERFEDGLFQNIHGNKKQDLFSQAIHYFKGRQ